MEAWRRVSKEEVRWKLGGEFLIWKLGGEVLKKRLDGNLGKRLIRWQLLTVCSSRLEKFQV